MFKVQSEQIPEWFSKMCRFSISISEVFYIKMIASENTMTNKIYVLSSGITIVTFDINV